MPEFGFDPGLIDAPGGPTVMVVATHRPHELSAEVHLHARGQLFGSSGGLLSVDLGESRWLVPTIHAVWLPPRHPHAGHSHGPFTGWSAYVSEEACVGLPSQPCTVRASGLLREAVHRAATWCGGPLDARREHVASVILDEIRTLPVEPFGLPLPADRRLQRIARAVIDDPADARPLEGWANWAAISTRTLSRRFTAETQFSFTAWRQRARLLKSLEMLAAGVPVGAVASDLGYASASAYIGQFRSAFGQTPAVYRRRL